MIEMIAAMLAMAPQGVSSFLADVPVAMRVSDTEFGDELVFVNRAGNTAKLLKDELPHYGRSEIFTLNNGPVFSGISRGSSSIPLLVQNGVASGDLEATSFSYFMWSVTHSSEGPYEDESKRDGCLYAVLGGLDIPSEFKNTIHKVRDADEMGVDGVRALDSYLFSDLLDGALDGPVELFFSVTHETRDLLPLPVGQRHASSIYYIKYENGAWTGLIEKWNAADLQIDLHDQIDALTVEQYSGGSNGGIGYKVLLSTANSRTNGIVLPDNSRELWVFWEEPGGNVEHTGPYYAADEETLYVDEHLHFDFASDGLDAMCCEDPPYEFSPASLRLINALHRTGWAFVGDQSGPAIPNAQFSSHLITKKVNGQREDRIRQNFRILTPVTSPIMVRFESSFDKVHWTKMADKVYPAGVGNRLSASWVPGTIPGQSSFLTKVWFRVRPVVPTPVFWKTHTLLHLF